MRLSYIESGSGLDRIGTRSARRPDVAAPGRYLIGPVPSGASMPATVPGRIVAPGYMWMSGTSFAAPIVAGAAAKILAVHPDWTADQLKGAADM